MGSSQNSEKLAAVIERLKSLSDDVKEVKNILKDEYITKIEFKNLKSMVEQVIKNQEDAQGIYLTRLEFRPYKWTFNMIGGLIITAITTAIASLVFRDGR